MRITAAILPVLAVLALSFASAPEARATVLGNQIVQPAVKSSAEPVYYYRRYYDRDCYRTYRSYYRHRYYRDYGYYRPCRYCGYSRSYYDGGYYSRRYYYSRHYRDYYYDD
jgi:hypothetical protein